MAKKANVLTIRVPDDLKHRIEKMADQQGVSINQFAVYALTREISELETSDYFRKYYSKKSKDRINSDFDKVLSKVPKGRVPDWDKVIN